MAGDGRVRIGDRGDEMVYSVRASWLFSAECESEEVRSISVMFQEAARC